jgi:hypothetical protein
MGDRYGKYFALLLVLASAGYGLFQARMLIQGPMLTVHAPREGVTEMAQLMEVRGRVENVTRVRVNGRTINTDPEGVFSEFLVTPDGYGVILVEAEDRFGYRTARRIEVFGMPHGVPGPEEDILEEDEDVEEVSINSEA